MAVPQNPAMLDVRLMVSLATVEGMVAVAAVATCQQVLRNTHNWDSEWERIGPALWEACIVQAREKLAGRGCRAYF